MNLGGIYTDDICFLAGYKVVLGKWDRVESYANTVVPPNIRPVPPKSTPLIRPDFRCTMLVKYY